VKGPGRRAHKVGGMSAEGREGETKSSHQSGYLMSEALRGEKKFRAEKFTLGKKDGRKRKKEERISGSVCSR